MEKEESHYQEPEFVDKAAWVPLGEEIIPAAQLLNGNTILVGRRYQTTDSPLIDKLLESRLIDESYHSMALRIINLFRLATSKQSYAVPTIFSGSYGVGNSDFCPMTVFIRATRKLSAKELFWIDLICGLSSRSYDIISQNVMHLKHVLETIEENLTNYEATQLEQGDFHEL